MSETPIKPSPYLSPSDHADSMSSGGSTAWRSASFGFDRRDWVLAALLVIATLLAFHPAWNGQPVWDDDEHMTKPELRSTEGLVKIWIQPGAAQQYYPLVHSIFWLEYRLWGGWTLPYHLVNLLLHTGCALLLVRVLRRLDVPGAWLAGAIFALHPVQVETAAWITELKNTLSGLCYLGAALAYLSFDRERTRQAYALALGLFTIGLMAKTVIASLPAALLVVLWWKRGRLSWRTDVRPLSPFFVVGACAGLFTAWMEVEFIAAKGAEFNFTLVERGLIAGRALCFYLGELVWPANLMFFYPRWSISQAVTWQYLFPAAFLLMLAVAWLGRAKSRAWLASLLFFAGTLFPALGFLNVAPFRYSFVADHFQYLACIGPIALLAAGLTLRFRRIAQRAGDAPTFGVPSVQIMAAGGLSLVLGVLTWRESAMFADMETLWRTTIRRNPTCAMAHVNLGAALLDQGRTTEASAAFGRALQLQPENEAALNNRGYLLLQEGKTDEAIRDFQSALRIRPDYATAYGNLGLALLRAGKPDEAMRALNEGLRYRPNFAEAHNTLGAILLQKRRADEAIVHFKQALESNPEFVDAHNNLSDTLIQQGRIDEAIGHYEKTIRDYPRFATAYNNLANTLLRKNRVEEAIGYYRKALELRPDYVSVHYNLGVVLLQRQQVEEAILHLQRVLQLKPDDPEALYGLGNALLQTGRTDEAISYYEKAIAKIPSFVEAHHNLGNALVQKGSLAEAIPHYEKVLELKPAHVDARYNLANAFVLEGKIGEAIAQYEAVLKTQPDFVDVLNNIAWVLATTPQASLRDGTKAVAFATRADRLSGGDNPVILHTLAAAYGEAGNFDEAAANAKKAIELAKAAGQQPMVEQLSSELALYVARKPFHEENRRTGDAAAKS